MKQIDSWATLICMVSIVCTLLELLAPDGNMKKTMKTVISMFMLCSIIFPLIKIISTIDLSLDKFANSCNSLSETSKSYSKTCENYAEEKINKLVLKTLNENGVKAKKVETSMDINETSSISINKTVIFLSENNKDLKLRAQSIAKRELGLDCDVVIIQEN